MTFRHTLDTVFRPKNENRNPLKTLRGYLVQTGPHTLYVPKVPSIFDIGGDLDERAKELGALAHFNYPVIESHFLRSTDRISLYFFPRLASALDFFVQLDDERYRGKVGDHPLMKLIWNWNLINSESEFKLDTFTVKDLDQIERYGKIISPHISKDGKTLVCDRER